MDKDNIKIQGHVGKWHVIDKKEHRGKNSISLGTQYIWRYGSWADHRQEFECNSG